MSPWSLSVYTNDEWKLSMSVLSVCYFQHLHTTPFVECLFFSSIYFILTSCFITFDSSHFVCDRHTTLYATFSSSFSIFYGPHRCLFHSNRFSSRFFFWEFSYVVKLFECLLFFCLLILWCEYECVCICERISVVYV